MDIGVIIAIGVSVATLVAVIGSGFYWSGRLSSRVSAQGDQIAAQGAALAVLTERVAAQGEQIAALTSQVALVVERLSALELRVSELTLQVGRHTDRLDTMADRTDGLAAEVASTRRELIVAVSHHVHHDDGSISFRAPLPETT